MEIITAKPHLPGRQGSHAFTASKRLLSSCRRNVQDMCLVWCFWILGHQWMKIGHLDLVLSPAVPFTAFLHSAVNTLIHVRTSPSDFLTRTEEHIPVSFSSRSTWILRLKLLSIGSSMGVYSWSWRWTGHSTRRYFTWASVVLIRWKKIILAIIHVEFSIR